MNKMIDSRCCQNFRKKNVCSNQNQDLLDYLDNRVITPMRLTFEPEEFDKALEGKLDQPQVDKIVEDRLARDRQSREKKNEEL